MRQQFNPDNQLFKLARSGKRLPHIILTIVLAFVFVLVAQLFGGTIGVLLVLLLSVLQSGMPVTDNPTPNDFLPLIMPDTALEQAIILILSFIPIFLVLWVWLALFEKRPLWTIGMQKAGAWQKYLRGLGVGLLMFVAAIAISAALGYISVENGGSQLQGADALGGVLLVFFGWMVQGSAEEAIARGWILPVIGARYKPWLGVLGSSLIFAAYHAFNPNLSLIAMLNLFLFGLFTALYALYEGGLWGVFSIHAVWNWAQGNLFGFEVSGNVVPGGTLFNLMETGPDVITGGAFGPEGGLAVTAVLLVSTGIVWWLFQQATPKRET